MFVARVRLPIIRPLFGPARLIPLALVLAVTASCGIRGEPTGALTATGPVTASDAAGSTVALPAPARTVAVTDSAAADTIAALAPDVKIERVTPAQLPALARAAAPPDLVVLGRNDPPAPAGLPAFRWPSAGTASPGHAIVQLGLLLGRGAAGVALGSSVDSKRAEVLARTSGAAPVRVLLEQGTFQALGQDSDISKVVQQLGGQNVVDAAAALTPARIKALDPEVWIGTSSGSSTLGGLRKLTNLRDVSAIRHGRVSYIDPAQLEPSPTLPDQLLALARILHPTA
jgi:ABC-type Fe3+-hydroxamate transport system substrate-binding protein